MSDKPLFNNIDEEVAGENRNEDEDVHPETTVASTAAAGAATAGPASGILGGPTGPGGVSTVGPAIGSEALAEEEEEEAEEGRNT